MKAAYIKAVGPPENIIYGNLPEPAVGETGVLVKVAAVDVNAVDTYILSDDGKQPIAGQNCEDLPRPQRRFRGLRLSAPL